MPADSYAIRPARPADLPVLPLIEHAAAAWFCATPYAYLADEDELVSADTDLGREYVWVIADSHDVPVGFAIVHELDASVHLHELDVHPDHARQGLGRRLIAAVAEWARGQGASALTLTTFDDVPWNGPYYARLGFRTLGAAERSPGQQAVLDAEIANGLPEAHRVCMQLDL